MKYIKPLRILTLALVLSLIAALLPLTPALAAGTLYADKSSGEVGEYVELYGSDFVPSYTYDFYFSDENAVVGEELDTDVDNYEELGVKTTDLNGTFVGFDFPVPSELTDGDDDVRVHGGSYYIYATYHNDEEIQARRTFTVESVALITIDPDDGTVGTEVEIDGEGYESDESITVEYDSSEVDIESGDDETDSDGEFSGTLVIIPPSTAGTHTITVIGDDSDLEAEAEFTVEPKITISPESGAAGTTITVEGTGFGDEVDVIITFGGSGIDTAETDDEGSFTADFPAPTKTAGSYTIEIEDDDENFADADFTIANTVLSISPTTGTAGTLLTISGSGFKTSTAITITFNSAAIPGTYTSDASGNLPGDITYEVPVLSVGEYEVIVTDGSNSAGKKFKITTSSAIVPATSVTAPGNVGSQITVNGNGFAPSGTMLVTYDSNQVATAIVKTNGSFSISFNAPVSIGGEHTIVATDGTNPQTFLFFMESTPPAIPPPLKPEMNIKAPAEAYFDWEDVTDPSGVTYTLQIATSNSFSPDSIVLEKAGLTQSEYTLTREERLNSVSKDAPYYWHIKAIDGASNESDWTGTGAFYVGLSFGISQPVIYVIIGICAVLLAVFAFWMGRKTAYY